MSSNRCFGSFKASLKSAEEVLPLPYLILFGVPSPSAFRSPEVKGQVVQECLHLPESIISLGEDTGQKGWGISEGEAFGRAKLYLGGASRSYSQRVNTTKSNNAFWVIIGIPRGFHILGDHGIIPLCSSTDDRHRVSKEPSLECRSLHGAPGIPFGDFGLHENAVIHKCPFIPQRSASTIFEHGSPFQIWLRAEAAVPKGSLGTNALSEQDAIIGHNNRSMNNESFLHSPLLAPIP